MSESEAYLCTNPKILGFAVIHVLMFPHRIANVIHTHSHSHPQTGDPNSNPNPNNLSVQPQVTQPGAKIPVPYPIPSHSLNPEPLAPISR